MKRSPQALLFDLDGTLLDTAPDLAHALNTVLGEDGRAPLPYAAIRPRASHGSTGLLMLAYQDAPGSPAFEARRRRLLEVYRAGIATHTRLFPGMADVLAHCERIALPWGIVTNKPAWLTDPLLVALGLARRAACVVSGDTTTHAKPHPAPLLAAASALSCAPRACLYVGDAERDVAAARAAGMPVVLAAYGYLDAGDNPDDWAADARIEAPQELLAWLPRT